MKTSNWQRLLMERTSTQGVKTSPSQLTVTGASVEAFLTAPRVTLGSGVAASTSVVVNEPVMTPQNVDSSLNTPAIEPSIANAIARALASVGTSPITGLP